MKKRILSLDLIRVFAIVGVVAIHAENITASKTNYLGGISWWFANTVHSLVVVSVPLFIMLTGALILNKKDVSYAYVFKKIVREFLPPLVFWWGVYFFWAHRLNPVDWTFFFGKFFLTDTQHLYFLQVVIGLYLVTPVVSKFLQKRKSTSILLLLAGLGVSLYQYLSFSILGTYDSTNMLVIFIPFIFYLVLGYRLLKVKIHKYWWVLLASIMLFLTTSISFTTYQNTLAYNAGNTTFWSPGGGNLFWEPFTVSVICLASVVFVLLNNIQNIVPGILNQKIVRTSLQLISEYSFGIYLIHPMVMDRLDHYFNLAIHLTTFPLWLYYLYRTGFVFIVSILLVWLLAQFKVTRALVGVRRSSIE